MHYFPKIQQTSTPKFVHHKVNNIESRKKSATNQQSRQYLRGSAPKCLHPQNGDWIPLLN